MSSLFGGSKSKSTSDNQAYGTINQWASPLLGYTQEGASGLSALLGGDTTGLDKFKKAMGYDWEEEEGVDSFMSQRASVGGLDSGATLKGLADYQTGLNNQYSTNYMNQLLGLSGIGTDAASALTSAGQKNVSTSTQKANIVGTIGKVGSAMASSGGF